MKDLQNSTAVLKAPYAFQLVADHVVPALAIGNGKLGLMRFSRKGGGIAAEFAVETREGMLYCFRIYSLTGFCTIAEAFGEALKELYYNKAAGQESIGLQNWARKMDNSLHYAIIRACSGGSGFDFSLAPNGTGAFNGKEPE